jgi:hypothetical protein
MGGPGHASLWKLRHPCHYTTMLFYCSGRPRGLINSSLLNAAVEGTPVASTGSCIPRPSPRNEVQEPRSSACPKAFGASQAGSSSSDHEECRRLAASCRRLAKTAPSSFLAAKLEEMAKKWLDVAAELEQVEAAVERSKISEKKAG